MFSRLFARSAPRNPPPGKASSFHVWWDAPVAAVEVAVTLEVLRRPQVDELFFWALQVSFDGGGSHIGLQHHPGYPNNGSVNWGGYDASGSILEGSESALPSALDNRNTRTYDWREGAPYRLVVSRSDRGWDGTVIDLERERPTLVRTLFAAPGTLRSPVVWSEVFASCEEADAAVRWSDFTMVDVNGDRRSINAGRLTYQRDGCTNTDSHVVDGSVVQATGVARTRIEGQTITW